LVPRLKQDRKFSFLFFDQLSLIVSFPGFFVFLVVVVVVSKAETVEDRIDDCNGRDVKCGRNESILTRRSAVLAILIREVCGRLVRKTSPKTIIGSGEPGN
jgi:hypothetical protein